jgi:ubiquinone biosynthesis protein
VKKVPDLIQRLDEYYPPRGGAPPPPPLPDIALIEHRHWGGYAIVASVAAVLGALVMLVLR